jgi:hypothetical protein
MPGKKTIFLDFFTLATREGKERKRTWKSSRK